MSLSPGLATQLQDLADREAIRSCLAQYCRGIDRRRFDLVADTYHPDAYDDHGDYRGGVAGLIEWMSARHVGVAQSLHAICQSSIEIVDNAAAVESTVLTFQRVYDAAGQLPQAGQPDHQVLGAVRFVDRFERRAGVWKVSHRRLVFESVLTLPTVQLDPSGDRTLPRRDEDDALWVLRHSLGLA